MFALRDATSLESYLRVLCLRHQDAGVMIGDPATAPWMHPLDAKGLGFEKLNPKALNTANLDIASLDIANLNIKLGYRGRGMLAVKEMGRCPGLVTQQRAAYD